MNLDEVIGKKNVELEEMQKDIDSLESQALPLKETVKKYNSLKKQSKALKLQKEQKTSELKIVLGFINTIDDSYIKNKYPLLESILINQPDAPAASAIN
jgi:hypothetical protein